MTELRQDPEINDDPNEGTGDDTAYDGEAAEFFEYDPSQFELPEDYEYEGDEDE